jgi:outer membrane protein TolC
VSKRTVEQAVRDELAAASQGVATALATVERTGTARDQAEARFQAAIKAHGQAEERRARAQRALQELTGDNPPTAAEDTAPAEPAEPVPSDRRNGATRPGRPEPEPVSAE